MHDLVIRGGSVVDGTGLPAFRADVAVDGDRIVAVGAVGPGWRTLDASGCLVTPGFVDAHTHLDAQLFWDPLASPCCWHGVTSRRCRSPGSFDRVWRRPANSMAV